MREGLGHKFTYLVVICVALIMEYGSDYINLGIKPPVFIPACAGICLTEITSIIKNCVKSTPNYPKQIFSIFSKSTRRKTMTKKTRE